MKDLTELFRKGIENGAGYESYDIRKAVNTLTDISCDLDDEGSNWELILLGAGRSEARVLGFVSRYYPVALLVRDCPDELIKILREMNVGTEFFDSDCPTTEIKKWKAEEFIKELRENNVSAYFIEKYFPILEIQKSEGRELHIPRFYGSFSCDEEILRKYAPFKRILDDRFLDDGEFDLNDERMYYIYENIPYITPYSFTFEEIR